MWSMLYKWLVDLLELCFGGTAGLGCGLAVVVRMFARWESPSEWIFFSGILVT